MEREYVGSFVNAYNPAEGVTVVEVSRQLGRIYLTDSEGFEQHIEPKYLAHGWNSVAKLLMDHYNLPRHRLILNGFPRYYKRAPEAGSSKSLFKRGLGIGVHNAAIENHFDNKGRCRFSGI